MTNPGSKEVGPALKECPFCGRKSLVEEFRDGDDPQPLFVATCEICPVKTYDQFSEEEAARVWNTRPTDSAGAMVDNASLKKLARRLIDAVINSPCVVEVRMFSQPEAVENLEDAIIRLMRAATPPAPKEEKAHRCPHCGRRMQSDFDEDVGIWYECANCDYREAVSSTVTAAKPLGTAREAAEEIREWLGISGLVDGERINEVAAIISRHFPATAESSKQDELVDEVQHRMDQVVEAAVEWHNAGREGGEWFEAAEKLGAAINSLLELRDEPPAPLVSDCDPDG